MSYTTRARYTVPLAGSHTSLGSRESGVSISDRAHSAAVWAAKHALRTLTTDPTGQLNVLGHDGHALGVYRAQVGVFE